MLGRLALVPQKIMNSYHARIMAKAATDGTYSDGDYIMSFGDCALPGRSCVKEMEPFLPV
jgi:mannan polymerase II complex MNN11 subunit